MKLPPLQEMLDAQGCLVMRTSRSYAIGEVVPNLRAGGVYGMEAQICAVVVIGEASEDEFVRQSKNFNLGGSHKAKKGLLFYKVTAGDGNDQA